MVTEIIIFIIIALVYLQKYLQKNSVKNSTYTYYKDATNSFKQSMNNTQQLASTFKKSGRIALILIVIIILLTSLFTTVPTGYRGVVTKFGKVTGKVFDEGLHLKIPFIEKVQKINIQIQKEETDADSSSKDLQLVNATVALNYRIDSTRVQDLYQDVGKLYVPKIIDPVIQEAVKSGMARFTAEELITKRAEVKEVIEGIMAETLAKQGITVIDFNIVNFSFSAAFDEAIEAKVTAEQEALAAKNKLEQIKFEAQQAVESSKGRAEAIEIEAKALRNNPDVLELRAIEKWDGVLPQVTGGAVPFVNLQ
jgi:regulator of protease activity HflC (stomatin/prohibitin superfamily)